MPIKPWTWILMTPAMLALCAGAAFGENHHVSTQGNDTTEGSQAAPWKTIQHAADKALPGDTITVLAGEYPERVRVKAPGQEGKPITFKADGKVQMRGFTVQASWISVNGFYITGTPDDNQDGWGIWIEGSHCIVENNHVHYATRGGILLFVNIQKDPSAAATRDCVVRGNKLQRNAMVGVEVHGRNHLVEGNEVWDTIQHHPGWKNRPPWVDADGMRFFGSGHVFRKNYIHDITFAKPENVNPHIDAFQSWSDAQYHQAASDVLFEQNVVDLRVTQAVHENGHGFMLANCRGLVIRNNVIKAFGGINTGAGGTRDLTIVNNLFVGSLSFPTDRYPCGLGLHDSPGAVVKNNIFYDQPYHAIYVPTGQRANQQISHNLIYRSDGKEPLGAPWPDELRADPRFVNPDQGDYHLKPDSPAIDRGTPLKEVTRDLDGNDRPAGKGHDIGPFEFRPAGRASG